MKEQIYSQEPEDALRHSASLSKLHTVNFKTHETMQNPEALSGHSSDGAYSGTGISLWKLSVLLLVFKRNKVKVKRIKMKDRTGV